ncbi:hypothetical protein [Streptomyces sp. MP131-18]|uniref:hypothetical protein n=1 Tax=Streptomyces sp. MP131-18 TaxID=1857892 RepID=UPI00097CAECF|nr:hypothetical protein [Streptomyces sp. MP131-18]ONK12615.1 hypothetical protein STBA_33630 [Streptomyces sp. MP131-18]
MNRHPGFYLVIGYTVDGRDRSVRFHVSTDGTRVYIVHWASEADARGLRPRAREVAAARWRAVALRRATVSKEPADLERMEPPWRPALPAALCPARHAEIADSLADRAVQLVASTRAERTA